MNRLDFALGAFQGSSDSDWRSGVPITNPPRSAMPFSATPPDACSSFSFPGMKLKPRICLTAVTPEIIALFRDNRIALVFIDGWWTGIPDAVAKRVLMLLPPNRFENLVDPILEAQKALGKSLLFTPGKCRTVPIAKAESIFNLARGKD